MRRFALRLFVASLVLLSTSALHAEVLEVVGSSSARVVEFNGDAAVQSDFGQAVVPTTVPEPPAISRAQLDRLRDDGSTSAGGQALAVFEQSRFLGIGNPNDVGIDIGAFSAEGSSIFYVEGNANESRRILITNGSSSIGTQILTNAISTTSAESTILLSGVLILASDNNTADLTGAESAISFTVQKRQEGEITKELVTGRVVLAGGPNGSIEITEQSGVFTGIVLPVIDLGASIIPEIPVVRVVVFAGVELTYEFDYSPGTPFHLDLLVSSHARAIPGGTGASAVFGLPQAALPSILARVKQDDTGDTLTSAVDAHVDTTGAAYANPLGLPFLAPFCGAAGFELPFAGFCAGAGLLATRRRRRPR